MKYCKLLDHDGLLMCKTQGEVFEKSLDYLNCSSPVFIKKYMNGFDAYSMDKNTFLNTTKNQLQMLQDIKDNDYGSIKYSKDELFWMGYIYRYWAYTRNIESKKLFKMCPSTVLKKYYLRGSCLTEEKIIEEICEDLGLEIENDETLNQRAQAIIESKIVSFKLARM